MKILALRGENLASIQHRFEIDFVNGALANNGLFAITGKTGSGKSTLLDAICLALYDRMPRLQPFQKNDAKIGLGEKGKIGANDVRSILSRGRAQCFAEVDFISMDGVHYRANWSVRRSRGKVDGNIQNSEQSLENLENNQLFAGKKTEVLNEIARLVGLSFDQFRRAVMLPQGDFAAFLKASSDERAFLLERMTGGDIYTRLSMAAYEKAKQEEAQLQALNNKMGDIHLLPEEEKDALEKKQAEEKKALNAILKQKDELKNHLTALEEQKKQSVFLQSAESECEQAKTAVAAAQPARDELAWVEKVQPASDDFKQMQQVTSSLSAFASKLAAQTDELTSLSQIISTAKASLQAVENKLDQKQNEWQATEPKLRQAEKKEVEITGLKKQLAEIEQALSVRNSDIETQKSKLTQAQNEKKQQEEKQQVLSTELANQQDFINIAEQFSFVQDNLVQYAKVERSFNQAQKEIAELEKQLPLLEKKAMKEANSFKVIEKDKQELEVKLQQIDIEATEKQQGIQQAKSYAVQNKQEKLGKLNHFASEWLNLLKEQAKTHLAQTELEKEAEKNQQQFAENEIQITECKARLTEAELTLEQSRAIADLTEYRNLLKEENPCPLCGAKEHPYAKEKPIVEGMLATQDKRVKEIRNELQTLTSVGSVCLKKSQDSQLGLTKLKQQQESLDKRFGEIKSDFNVLLTECEENAQNVLGFDPELFSEWLASIRQKIQSTTQEIKHISAAITSLSQELSQAYANQKKLSELNQAKAQYQEKSQQIESEKALIQERIISQQTQQAKEGANLANKKSALTHIYTNDDWLTLLNDLGEQAYLAKLKKEVKHIFSLREKIKQVESQLIESNPTIAKFEQALTQLQSIQTKEMQGVNAFKAQIASLQQERAQICPHPNLEQYEEQIRNEIDKAQHEKKDAEVNLTLVTEQWVAKQSTIQALQEQQQNAHLQQQELKQKWANWLQQFALTESRLAKLLNLDSHWQKTRREELQTLDKAVERCETLVKERKQHLENSASLFTKALEWLTEHQADSEAGANALNIALSKEQSQKEEIIYDCRNRLDASEKAAKQAGDLVTKIQNKEEEARVWLQLKELIGSNDGKKFRNIAQALTLNQLVFVANEHLQELSPRYALETVNSSPLALQVIDHDMGDEVRSVESLSGGESFLVSLSLALALASLAADTRKLGSLFIDEGFGTLDPDSLEMTLACLDALQADGRQIGVISHVTTLVERIGAQVVVEAQGGGVSRVKTPIR